MTTPIGSRLQRIGDTYLVEDTDLRGGYRVVATITERNAIGLSARRAGMVVFVQADKTEYTLNGGTGNSFWTVKTPFTGQLHIVHTALIRVSTLQQYDPYTFEVYVKQLICDYFNSLDAAQRIINRPVTYFKVLRAIGTPETSIGTTLPTGSSYMGDATLLYDGVPSNDPVTIAPVNLICISKSLIPLGDAVIAAMDEYALRKDAGGTNG